MIKRDILTNDQKVVLVALSTLGFSSGRQKSKPIPRIPKKQPDPMDPNPH